MKKQAIIFGTGSFAEVVDFYLTHDSCYDVVAFTVNMEYLDNLELLGRPVVPFEDLKSVYSSDEHEIFVAVGYKQMNAVRENVCFEAKDKGYKLLSYISSKSSCMGQPSIGENVFIFEDNTIQPFVEIGSGTVLWSGNHIGHHSSIGEYCFISSHVVVSGNCRIGSHSFIGVNATITDGVSIGTRNLIGPGSLIQKNTTDEDVYLVERTKKHSKPSSRFMR